jgi:cytochrome c biogenesis protein CcmG/thiol:disulfide interchange protein DsbE
MAKDGRHSCDVGRRRKIMTTGSKLNLRVMLRAMFVLLPLILFLGLTLVFVIQLRSGDDESILPSTLIGKVASNLDLPPLSGLSKRGEPVPGIATTMTKGHLTLVSFWASWCEPCREEQPLLLRPANDNNLMLIGVDYKDHGSNARNFLDKFGNPFDAVGVDRTGDAGIEWGVYGIPETFLVSTNGIVLYKHVGPLTVAAIRNELVPRIRRALAKN